MEYLDIVTEDGIPTGRVKERRAVEQNAFPHCIYQEELQILRTALFKSLTKSSIS